MVWFTTVQTPYACIVHNVFNDHCFVKVSKTLKNDYQRCGWNAAFVCCTYQLRAMPYGWRVQSKHFSSFIFYDQMSVRLLLFKRFNVLFFLSFQAIKNLSTTDGWVCLSSWRFVFLDGEKYQFQRTRWRLMLKTLEETNEAKRAASRKRKETCKCGKVEREERGREVSLDNVSAYSSFDVTGYCVWSVLWNS